MTKKKDDKNSQNGQKGASLTSAAERNVSELVEYQEEDIVLIGSHPATLVKKIGKKEWKVEYFEWENILSADEKDFIAIHVNDEVFKPKRGSCQAKFDKAMIEVKKLLAAKEDGWGSKDGRHKKYDRYLIRKDQQAIRDVVAAGGTESPDVEDTAHVVEAPAKQELAARNTPKTKNRHVDDGSSQKSAETSSSINRKRAVGQVENLAESSDAKKKRLETPKSQKNLSQAGAASDKNRQKMQKTESLFQQLVVGEVSDSKKSHRPDESMTLQRTGNQDHLRVSLTSDKSFTKKQTPGIQRQVVGEKKAISSLQKSVKKASETLEMKSNSQDAQETGGLLGGIFGSVANKVKGWWNASGR